MLSAFGLAGVKPVYLGASWEGGWRCGEVVLSLVADNARAAWSARVRETLFVDGVRLARPVRSTDGRYVVSGWRADTFVAGTPEPGTTKSSRRRCACTRRRANSSGPAS
ncbi:hypothetical protein I549_1888 [Mycobacterium avium subsp. avium 2285 (R)]|nr:hypothetical protein I549_1888 [Mycobacterium avium subsp. avium 2285 (R)]